MTDLFYQPLSYVLSSWEHANQKYCCREDIGNKILAELFEIEPETKVLFGFKQNQENIESNPMLRMGLMVHGLRIVHMIDSVLDLMGPDTDILNEILSEQARRHEKHGVKREHFAHMGTAIRGALSKLLGSTIYTKEVDMAWKETFDFLSFTMVQSLTTKGTATSSV